MALEPGAFRLSVEGPGQYSINVPTMDEFNALKATVDKNTADIASLNTRVTKLESGTQPPNKTPSPDGTTVTGTTGSIIDSRLRTFTLSGTASNYRIVCDGNTTGNNVAKLYAKAGLCYQQNTYGNWYVANKDGAVDSGDDWVQTSDPTGAVPPQPSGVPPQAAAVGYTMRTQGPHVTIGQNIYVVEPGNGVVQNADGSITDNGPTNGNYHYNFHFGTERSNNGNFAGVAFGGGGYFEIEMSIRGNIVGWRNPVKTGWPAWWFDALEGAYNDFPTPPGPSMQHIEYDAAEFLPASNNDYSAGLIHWSDAQKPNADSFNNNSVGQDSNVHCPNQADFSGRHKYGFLWVPATATTPGYAKNFYDNKQVGATYTWTPYNAAQNGQKAQDPGDPPWCMLDRAHLRTMVGTCIENPMTVYSMTVWQKDDSKNIRRGIPLPTND